MQILEKTVAGLLLLVACHYYAAGQSRVDSLRSILDQKKLPDSVYVKTCLEFCKSVVNTNREFLLPEYARKGLEADPGNRDIESRSALFQFLGNHYWQNGKLNEAAEHFNQMRLIGETYSKPGIKANSFVGLGTVYYLMKEYDMALTYYRQGLDISGTDSLLKVRLYANIANTFFQQDKIDSVLLYYGKSRSYHLAHQNFRHLSIVYSNIALVYMRLHERKEIMKNLDLALDAAIKSNDPYQIAAVYQTMGYMSRDKHPDISARSYKKSLELAQENRSFDQIRTNLENLAYLSQNSGKLEETATYLWQLKQLTDSLDLEQKKISVQQMEAEHDDAISKIEEMKRVQSEELKAAQDHNRQRNLLFFLTGAFVAVFVLFLLGIRNYLLKMKITRTKERFFSMIAHDIRNPFSGILGLSGLLNDEAEKSDDPVHRKQVRSLHQSLNQVYDLLENLLQWSQAETGKIAFDPQVQLLSPFVHEVICLHSASCKQKGITLTNQIQSGLTARFDSNMLQTVMRNLLSNAIKFSGENTGIFISAEIQGKAVLVKVKDEGIGMSREKLDQLFKGRGANSTPGTHNETGTGLGLVLCNTFITRHGGKIWAESNPGSGTTVCFTLPD